MDSTGIPASLENIPTDVQYAVLGYISRPSDLRSLCLVSKRLFDVATPCLYRNIRLPYRLQDGQAWTRVTKLAQSSQLQHVRSIEIGQHHYQKGQLCRPLHDLLARLPPNTLSAFHYFSSATPEACDARLLWDTQTSLKRLNFNFWMCSLSLHDIVHQNGAILRRLQSLSEVSIDLGDVTNPDLIRHFLFLLDSGNLKAADITWDADRLRNDHSSPSSNLVPILEWLPQNLTHLSFRYVEFPDQVLCQGTSFACLKRLELEKCRNIATILSAIREPTVEELIIRFVPADYEDDFTRCLDFIMELERLRILIIANTLSINQLARLPGHLRTRGSTLRSLLLDGLLEASQILSDWLPYHGANIEELAVRVAGSPGQDIFTSRCIAIISQLNHLRVLNVFYDAPSERLARDWEASYDKATQRVASTVFTAITSLHPLQILAFGMRWCFGSSLEAYSCTEPSRCSYQRRKGLDVDIAWGASELIAEDELRYVYPGSEILEYAFTPHVNTVR